MKRLISLLLCATLLIAFVACSEAGADTETATETEETATTETAETATEEGKNENGDGQDSGKGEQNDGDTETPVTTTKKQSDTTNVTTTKAQGGQGTTAPDPTQPTKTTTSTTKRQPTTTTVVVTTRKPPVTTTAKQVVTHFKNENLNGRYEAAAVSAVLLEGYWENGTFVARIALVNTTGATQTGVYLKTLVIRGTNGQIVCDAGFTTQGQNFTIQDNQYIVHTYRMSGAAAPNQGTDIDTVSVSAFVAKI